MTPLYLDDLRPVPSGWAVARSFDDAVAYVETHGVPSMISFDHDLGEAEGVLLPTGYDFAKWLVERDLDRPGFIPADFQFTVHSANPVGARNITGYLEGYLAGR